MTGPDPASIRTDAFLGGAVAVRQPATGYRAGHDAVLLAASLAAAPGQRLLDAGCGAGAALLCAAHRLPACTFVGIERDAAMAALACEGVTANGFGARVTVATCDLLVHAGAHENAYDQTFSNPPFFEPRRTRAPAAGKAHAWMADVPLEAWLGAMLRMTRTGGHVTVIHRPEALEVILAVFARRAGEVEVRPLLPRSGAPAKRILVRARSGLRSGALKLLDGLVMTPPGDAGDLRHGPVQAALTGAALDWS